MPGHNALRNKWIKSWNKWVDTHCAVDVLRDCLVWWLILTADSQPNIAFVSFYQPAVPSHLSGQVEQQQGREQQEKLTDSGSHRVTEEFLMLPHQKEWK